MIQCKGKNQEASVLIQVVSLFVDFGEVISSWPLFHLRKRKGFPGRSQMLLQLCTQVKQCPAVRIWGAGVCPKYWKKPRTATAEKKGN